MCFPEIKKKKLKFNLKIELLFLTTEVVVVQPCVTGQFGMFGLICLEFQTLRKKFLQKLSSVAKPLLR